MAKQTPLPEIRTCPFCGCKATLEEYEPSNPILAIFYERYSEPEYFVRCSGARCKMQPETDVFSTKGAAINAWNKRK